MLFTTVPAKFLGVSCATLALFRELAGFFGSKLLAPEKSFLEKFLRNFRSSEANSSSRRAAMIFSGSIFRQGTVVRSTGASNMIFPRSYDIKAESLSFFNFSRTDF